MCALKNHTCGLQNATTWWCFCVSSGDLRVFHSVASD